jgi:hypothetical protein
VWASGRLIRLSAIRHPQEGLAAATAKSTTKEQISI